LSKPCGKVCGGRLPSSARPPSSRSSASSPPRLSRSSARAVALTAAPTSTTNPRATVALTTLRIILHLLIGRVALRRTLHDVRLPFASPFHAEAAGPPRRLVGRKLVGPELRPDLPDLVGPFEAKRVRGAQVFLAPVVEHLEDLDGGSLEQTDSAEVVRVGRLERRRRLERTQPGL